jgi:hypothetical protein
VTFLFAQLTVLQDEDEIDLEKMAASLTEATGAVHVRIAVAHYYDNVDDLTADMKKEIEDAGQD